MNWTVEDIPDPDKLFFRIHQTFIHSGEVKPKVFVERGTDSAKGMSTNWDKYSTAQNLKDGARVPEDNGIASFITGEIRNIGLKVNHAPLEDNQSHTNISGLPGNPKDTKFRLQMMDMFKWEILPSVEVERNDTNFKD